MDELNRQRKLVDESFNQAVAIVEGLENRKNTIESLVQTLPRLGSDHDG
jgi:ABC-type transporter Mla subunit MlaD